MTSIEQRGGEEQRIEPTLEEYKGHVAALMEQRQLPGVDPNEVEDELTRLVSSNPGVHAAYMEELRIEREQQTTPIYWYRGDRTSTTH